MISVLTPSIRPDMLGITKNCLEQQTFQDFEWITELGLEGRGFTLPADFNKMLKRAQGDIIVILQDCISIPFNALEIINSLDHDKTAYTYPVGKTGRVITMIETPDTKWDWRKDTAEARKTDVLPDPAHWEIDFASAPKSLFFDVGGFDEAFCQGWSWENVEIAWRASHLGYNYKVNNQTFGLAFDHDSLRTHPFRNKGIDNDRRANQTRVMAEGGRIKLGFL